MILQLLHMLGFDFQKIAKNKRFSTDFDDLGIIGSGGFAEVRKARDRNDGKLYAVKIITLKTSNTIEETEQNFYRTLSEVKIHSQLDHPYVLKYHGCWMELTPYSQEELNEIPEQDCPEPQFQMVVQDDSCGSDGFVFGPASSGREQNTPVQKMIQNRKKQKVIGDGKVLSDYKQIKVFILSQLCQMNLQSFIYQRSQTQCSIDDGEHYWQRNLEIALEMTKGLSYIHSKRIIHRDVKLHNFLLNDKNQCKLIDFGLARKTRFWKSSLETHFKQNGVMEEDEEEEELSKSVGTRLFSSPEQANSEKYDYRTDIFSLAMVIVMLFCSFTTVHAQRSVIEVIRLRKLDSIKMPPRLKSLMHRGLGSESERPSIGEIQTLLRQLLREVRDQKSKMPLGVRKVNYNLESQRFEIAVNDEKGH